ncbi:MAG TPA: EAL domain-containing protein [Burkholderiales bacterium]|nr:EAL domain-containing protein [Burkholderiales bacterium]
MTLFKQLILGVSLVFLALLAGVEAIYLANARVQLQAQMSSQAQEAATSLSIRLAALGSLENRDLVETLLNPVFDRGYFQEIRVLSPGGEIVVRKVLPRSEDGVPEWFRNLFPIPSPGAQSLVSSGWRELGRVVVVSQPYFAYRQLWSTGLQTVAWLLFVYVVAIAAVGGFLAMLLRPLREIERVAVAIGERDFTTIALQPRARELSRVVAAMNAMSGRIRQMIAEESARAEALRREAFIDPVTSLYNRRGFERQLQALIQSTGDVYSGALALVEIRNFGEFNAKVGYRRGDEVLAKLAGALVTAGADRAVVCARMGGAGFAFAVVNIEAGALRSLVEAVCSRIAQVLNEEALESELHFHCGATRREGALPEFSALLASADHAVERAHQKGNNEYDIETFDQSSVASGSQAWKALIERCLEEDRIALFAQVVFGLPGRMPVHSELMVRLLGAQDEPIPAAQFLPMAARHGLIGRLDCRVLEKILDYLSRSPGQPMVALNVAAQTIADPEINRRMLALLDARPALAARLVFEMTEFGAMQDWNLARRFSGEVRRRGARFALDNFGMLQESLMLVHALRPQYIKLSPGYSREIAGNEDCRFLVASLVRIAQPLDIGIYAQAIENEDLIPVLADLGLSGYQGFAASRPVKIL